MIARVRVGQPFLLLVRQGCGTYTATCDGHRVSCTSGPEEAARRAVLKAWEKAMPPGEYHVEAVRETWTTPARGLVRVTLREGKAP